ncbi:MAG: hypothetical protein J5910_05400 [Lachnospiraceae bacterium]|nr:hypothetical protein [Lachnospiraceae bacterium]
MNAILLMSDDVKIALISGGTGIITALITAIATFQLSTKKDRKEQRQDLKAELLSYHNKNREEIEKIRQNDLGEIRKDITKTRDDITKTRDDITQMGANLQQKIAVVEVQQQHIREDVVTLSSRVEKHNGVIERTYRLEDNDKLLEEKISVGNHRISDLEEEVRRLKR